MCGITGCAPVATRMFSAVMRLPVDFDGMRIDERRPRLEERDVRILQQLAVDAFEPVELLVLVGDQRRPIETRRRARASQSPRASSNASANCAP